MKEKKYKKRMKLTEMLIIACVFAEKLTSIRYTNEILEKKMILKNHDQKEYFFGKTV